MTRTYDVWKHDNNGAPRIVGMVAAMTQVHADTKAKLIFGHKVWTKERVAA